MPYWFKKKNLIAPCCIMLFSMVEGRGNGGVFQERNATHKDPYKLFVTGFSKTN